MYVLNKKVAVGAIVLFSWAQNKVAAQDSLTHNKENIVEFVKRKFFSNQKDTLKKPSLMPLPVFSYAQETGAEVGLMGLYSFYTDKEYEAIRNSSISIQGTYTQKHQSTFKARSDIWTKRNLYHLHSEIRYANFPAYYYGIGDHTLQEDKQLLNEKTAKVSFSGERQWIQHYYAGLRLGYQYFKYSSNSTNGIYTSQPPYGRTGGNLAYIGLSQTFDNRNTNTYTTHGQYLHTSVDWAPNLFGKDNYRGAIINVDYRAFHSFTDKLVLGIQAQSQNMTSQQVPFYAMSMLGGDELMRGYYRGRYRDRNLLAGQAELRYRIIPRFGVVAFAGTGTVYGEEALALTNFKPNYGGGLRYFFDLARKLSVRIDYGVGEHHAGEKRQGGWYFSLGEAF